MEGEDKPHPLLLSPIIHNVMEFLSIRDLISSRLVCQNWNTAASSTLRKVKVLKFRMQPEHIYDYTATMKGSKAIPYSQYELEFYHMGEEIVQNFLAICGSSIASLQLNNCACTTVQLLEILCALKGNLKCFSFNCDAIKDDENHSLSLLDSQDASTRVDENSPKPAALPNLKSLSFVGEFSTNEKLIHDLMRFSPNLESIELRCYDNLCEVSPFETMCYEVFLRDTVPMEGLTSFKMKSKVNDTQILNLLSKNLQYLTCLHINLDCDVRPGTLLKLLERFANNIKKLDLCFGLEDVHVRKADEEGGNTSGGDDASGEREMLDKRRQYVLPAMNNLYRLTLSNFKGSLVFINDCEKLKYLALINCDVSLVTLAQVQRHPLKSLVSTTFLDSAVCTRLAQVFPDLKELNIELDDQILRTVFKIMPGLEELTISGDKVTDDGITGTDNVYRTAEFIIDNTDLEHNLSFLLCFEGNMTHLRKFPFIGNLKNLRKIQIQNAGFISDASVIHGLILCNSLQEISLLNSKVTDCSLRAIADYLPQLKKLETLSHFPSVTSQGKAYIRNKLTGCDLILGQQDIIYLYRPRQVRMC